MNFLIGINDLMKSPLVEMMAWLWLPPLPSLKKDDLGARCGILTCGMNHLQRCSKDHHLLCLGCTPFRLSTSTRTIRHIVVINGGGFQRVWELRHHVLILHFSEKSDRSAWRPHT